MKPAAGVVLNTCRLNHPNGACGYRIDYAGKSVCVITDTEHVPGRLDQAIVDFVRGADIMIYDSMFTDDEFPKFVTRSEEHTSELQSLMRSSYAVLCFKKKKKKTQDLIK